jgi:hypothetical protein
LSVGQKNRSRITKRKNSFTDCICTARRINVRLYALTRGELRVLKDNEMRQYGE